MKSVGGNQTVSVSSGGVVFLVLGGIALLGRWIADRMDRQRILANLAERGDKPIRIRWNPFGPGWFGEKGERIYEVEYINHHGRRVIANCKTSLFSGIYWQPANEEPAAAAKEPIICLACGHSMGRASKCPRCGWSYGS